MSPPDSRAPPARKAPTVAGSREAHAGSAEQPTTLFLNEFDTLVEAGGGMPALRKLVLNLAIRGRLSRPERGDDCTRRLQGAADDDRHSKLSSGQARQMAELPAVSEAEAPFTLPDAWAWTRIGLAMNLVNGRAFKPEHWSTAGLPIVRIQNLNDPSAAFNYCSFPVDPKHELQPGDLLISWSGTPGTSFGAFIWRGPRGVLNQHIFRVEIYARAYEPAFLRIAVNARLDEMIAQAHGAVGLQHITKGKLEALAIPLPSLAEQKRIVAKVDQLMALCDELEARQTKKRDISTRLTKSALEALTTAEDPEAFDAAWARVVENFDVLVGQSRQVGDLRRQVLALGIAGRLHGAGPQRSATTVGDFVSFQNGYAFKSEWFKPHGTRLLRNANVGHGELGWAELACVGEAHAGEFSRFALEEGDIVVSLDRPIISTGVKVARVRPVDLPCLLLQRVGRVLIKDRTLLTANYFFHWLRSPWFVDAIDPGRSNGVPHISTKQIEALPFSPPSVGKQDEIVRLIDRLLGTCDQLEEKLRRSEVLAARVVVAAVDEILA